VDALRGRLVGGVSLWSELSLLRCSFASSSLVGVGDGLVEATLASVDRAGSWMGLLLRERDAIVDVDDGREIS
jgi:hypothetical protein